MNLKSRVKRLEQKANKSKIGAIKENHFKMVYKGDPNYEEQAERHRKQWLDRHSTLEGLRVVYHNIPDPDPIDMDFYKAED